MGFDFEVQYKKGQDNKVADALSRMQRSDISVMVINDVHDDLLQHI